jgi:hypothetical protein
MNHKKQAHNEIIEKQTNNGAIEKLKRKKLIEE